MQRIFTAVFLLLIVSLDVSSEQISPDTVEKLIRKSGSWEQTKQTPEGIIGVLEQYRENSFLTDEIFSQFSTDIRGLFDHGKFIQGKFASISKALSQEEAEFILAWLDSDLGQRLVLAEIENDTESAYQLMHKNKKQLMADTEGVDFSRSLDEVLGLSDRHLRETIRDLRLYGDFFAKGFQFAREQPEITDQEIASVSTMAKENNLLWGIQTYGSFTQEEKQRYLNFLATDAYQNYTRANASASDVYMQKYGLAIVEALSDLLYKDQFRLDTHLVVSYPEGEDLTFQTYDEGDQQFLMGWTGEEQDFEFVHVQGVPGAISSEQFWSLTLTSLNSASDNGSYAVWSSGDSKSLWGAAIEYRVFVHDNPEEGVLAYYRVFNNRISYIVAALIYKRSNFEKHLERTLNIVNTAKIIK